MLLHFKLCSLIDNISINLINKYEYNFMFMVDTFMLVLVWF
jgi:hypothetical protein